MNDEEKKFQNNQKNQRYKKLNEQNEIINKKQTKM